MEIVLSVVFLDSAIVAQDGRQLACQLLAFPQLAFIRPGIDHYALLVPQIEFDVVTIQLRIRDPYTNDLGVLVDGDNLFRRAEFRQRIMATPSVVQSSLFVEFDAGETVYSRQLNFHL